MLKPSDKRLRTAYTVSMPLHRLLINFKEKCLTVDEYGRHQLTEVINMNTNNKVTNWSHVFSYVI